MEKNGKSVNRLKAGAIISALCLVLLVGVLVFLELDSAGNNQPDALYVPEATTPDSTVPEENISETEPAVPQQTEAPEAPQQETTPAKPAPPKEDWVPQATEPKEPDPAPTEPKPTEPVPTEPAPTEPTPTEPTPTEPVPTEPVPTEPTPTEPIPTEPEPTEPEQDDRVTVLTGEVPVEDGTVAEDTTFGDDDISAEVPAGVQLEDDTSTLVLTITEKESSDSGVDLENDQVIKPLDVHMDGISAENTQPITICLGKILPGGMNIGNVTLYHVEDGTANPMTQVLDLTQLTDHNDFYYDPVTGDITVAMATFSEVALVSETAKPWEGEYDYSWYDASATELTIANADQLVAFGRIVGGMAEDFDRDNFTGKTVKLIADINLNDAEESDTSKIFHPIGYYYTDDKNADGTTGDYYSTVYSFCGTFDGQGHTIANFYQNTWQIKGDYDANYYKDAMGLFGYVVSGKVENLTVDHFSSDGEFTPTGVIAAYAVDSTFENIAITNCNPRVYNTGNGGIVGVAGNSSDTSEQTLTFTNITIDNTNKISALWGSWDVACGGLMGMFRGYSEVTMTNCHVAAQIDVYNDVCGNYQYYWYRYSGMLIGSLRGRNITDDAGYTVPDMTGITASGCSVHFGSWNDYYYCELVANSIASYTHDHQFSRLEQIDSVADIQDENGDWSTTGNYLVIDGDTKTCYHIIKDDEGNLKEHSHDDYDGDGENDFETVDGEQVPVEDKRVVYLPFNQLFQGDGWGVKHIPIYDNEEENVFPGVTILDRAEANSVIKFESTGISTVTPGQVLTLGQLFQEKADCEVAIKPEGVQIAVTDLNDEDGITSAEFVPNASNWAEGTLTFNDVPGAVLITIQDYYFCIPTPITLTVEQPSNVTKFISKEIGTLSTKTITLGELFSYDESCGVAVDPSSVTVTATALNDTGVTAEFTRDDTAWEDGYLTFNGEIGQMEITIRDDNRCAPTTITLSLVKTERFEVSLPEASFLYRVGNANSVTLSSLFKAVSGEENNIGAVTAVVSNISGDAAGTYTANAIWTSGTIQFSGTGVVSVTISDDSYSVPLTLNLEVIAATNVTDYSGLGNRNSVLLCDITMSSGSSYYLSGATLYGNGFTFDVTDGAYASGGNVSSNYLIYLANAALDNVEVVGAVYTSYGATVKDAYNRPVVLSVGNNTITNSYISNCAAPVRVNGGNLEIVNSTLKGGNFANIDIRNGHVILDNVTTINQVKGNDTAEDGTVVVGLGVVVYYENVLSTTTVEIKNGITQYNVLSENQASTYITDSTASKLVSAMFESTYSALQYNDGSDIWINTGILSMTETVGDANISDIDGYVEASPSMTGVTGYIHTSVPTETSITATAPVYTTAGQGAIAPAYSFDYTTKNYVAKTDGSNDYCYEENGTVTISMDAGDTFNWDTSILTATKNGQTLSYTVTMNGTDYTGSSIPFSVAGNYEVIYTYTDNNNYGVDTDSNITTYSKTYTKSVHISVAVIKASAKNAEFTLGSSNAATEKITASDNKTYISATGVTADNSTWTYMTIGDKKIYYPIVAAKLTSTKGSSTNAYFPVFENVVTITDYADSGTGDAFTYNSSTTTLPSTLTAVKGVYKAASDVSNWYDLADTNLTQSGASNIFKWASSSSAPSDPETYSSVLCYKSPQISADRVAYITLVQYSYTDATNTTYYYYVGYTLEAFTKQTTCVTPDTLVTLADGSQKRIDQVTYSDQLLVWNFYTGEYDAAPASIIKNHGSDNQTIVTLHFDDGTSVKTIDGHGFFHQASNEYVILDESNAADYMGHSFIKQDGEGYSTAKLVDFTVTEEYTESWSVLTAKHYNAILEGMFTLTPAEVEGSPDYLMPFEVGEGLKYDEAEMQADIEQYGLYTYEDFAQYMTYEQFAALGLDIFKISVGKGYITWDDILFLIHLHIS